jgi:WhiB family transcriptional regulator, redox-sensing transcriptional regulator
MADRRGLPAGDGVWEDWSPDLSWTVLMRLLWGRGRRPEWQTEASCRDRDPGLWDGGRHTSERARAICGGCPVRWECLADVIGWETKTATRAANPFGVAGAMTASERLALYRALPGSVGVGEPGKRRRSPRRV